MTPKHRSSPVALRKAIEAANAYTKAGLLFVPMPVMDDEDHDDLRNQATIRLTKIINGLEDDAQ